jgi:hypothetical protein
VLNSLEESADEEGKSVSVMEVVALFALLAWRRHL